MVIQGVIRPPPEIRAVADRTALYVAKNGRAFERKILSSEKGRTPKFAFLQETSPFHAYYEDRVEFYEKGGTDEKENKEEEKKEDMAKKEKEEEAKKLEVERQKELAMKASVIDPVASALLAQRSRISKIRKDQQKIQGNRNDTASEQTGEDQPQPKVSIPPPPPLQFVNIVAPASLSIQQIETIQLVAQFTALDGKGGPFLSQLTLREWNNPAFAFCQPRHGHFAYFSALVDAYRSIMNTWIPDAPADDIKGLANNIPKCLEVAAYRAEYERDQEERSTGKDDTLSAAAQIDWHSFVVVETIDFAPDEAVETSMLPPPPPPVNLPTVNEGDKMYESDEEEQIRVVPSYQPKVVSTHEQNKLDKVIDPITGKSIAVEDMTEHMRIQLLDPKWAEERKKFQEKQKESNLVGGDAVVSNLERLAKSRKDGLQGESGAKSSATSSANNSAAVGPLLPGEAARKRPALSLPQPSNQSVEPDSKRARVDTIVVQPSMPPPPPPPPPPAAPVAAPPPRPEELFAAAVTGEAVSATTASSTSDEIMPEADFIASLSKPLVTLQIRIPNDPSQIAWNFYGQIVSVNIDVKSTILQVKEEISRVHLNGLRTNKFQLKLTGAGIFLNDNSRTLAAYNIGPTATIELSARVRGGRK